MSLAARWQRRNFGSTIVWDDQLPAAPIEKEPVNVVAPHGRFYVPPPYSDAVLAALTSVADWPKSRTVWALGRLSYTRAPVQAALWERVDSLLDTMNTRDLVRVLQASAYSLNPTVEVIVRARKIWCTKMDHTNDLFFVSGLYGHLKLVNRVDWALTPTCESTSKFLLSELVHRRNKIHASDFLDVAAAVLTGRQRFPDWTAQIIKHAVDHSIDHVRDIRTVARFFRSLAGHSEINALFVPLNDKCKWRLAHTKWRLGRDLIDFGFYLLLQDLLTHANIIAWVQQIKARTDLGDRELVQLNLVQEILRQRGLENLAQQDNSELFLSKPSLAQSCEEDPWVEPFHVARVLVRTVEATTAPGQIGPQYVGPFFCRVVAPNDKIVVAWKDAFELVPPHKRELAKLMHRVKTSYMHWAGWRLVELDRTEFSPNGSDHAINNSKFQHLIQPLCPSIVWQQGQPPTCRQPATVLTEPQQPRMRRESKRKENKLKATLRLIGKEWRRKASRKLKHKKSS